MPYYSETSQNGRAASLSFSDVQAIETRDLSKRFGPRQAVDALNMSVPSGTIAGFIGPNGAGKTTTIRLLLGLVCPTAGHASVLGQSIAHPRAYLSRVGALIEAPAFYPSLNARANLEVLACLGGHPRSRIGQVLEVVGLSERAKDQVRTYSLGMKQRLGIAMALLPDPDLLILDEPANGLDPLGIIEVRDLLHRLRDQGKTVFISSHLLGELEQVSDWLVMLHQGKAVFNGPARDLVARRSQLIVEVEETAQREVVARIAAEAGYQVTKQDGALRIACPADFAEVLTQRAKAAGVVRLSIQRSQASLEESFLEMLKGEQA